MKQEFIRNEYDVDEDDYYVYDADKMCVTGEHSLKKFSLGDEITIVVKYADVANRTIDFLLAK